MFFNLSSKRINRNESSTISFVYELTGLYGNKSVLTSGDEDDIDIYFSPQQHYN